MAPRGTLAVCGGGFGRGRPRRGFAWAPLGRFARLSDRLRLCLAGRSSLLAAHCGGRNGLERDGGGGRTGGVG